MSKQTHIIILDTSNLSCPMPMVKLNKAIKKVLPDGLLEIIATDQGALSDIPSWCKRTGNALVESSDENGQYRFLIKKLAN